MSSELAGTAVIAAAVAAALPTAIVLGAGWLAWQGGTLLLDANAEIDREIAEKKRQAQQAERQRKLTALAGHEQLAAMCGSVLAELDASADISVEEREALRRELEQICAEQPPDDPGRIEAMNAVGFARLEQVICRRDKLRELRISSSGADDGPAVADLTDGLHLAILAAEIAGTTGPDVKAADPLALERARLNKRLAEVSGWVMTALEFAAELEENYGISDANNAWFRSCFNGIDERLTALCSPAVSNDEMKKGIRSLEEIMERYDMLYPTLEREKRRLAALYPVYTQAAQALGERVRRLKHFKSSEALEKELKHLEKRAERAKTCAEIYQKLGPEAYLCYAWDEELRAQGYSVHTRKEIAEMAGSAPTRAKEGNMQLPFYRWSGGALTQMYSIAPECSLQLAVHPDGTITMQTIAGGQEIGYVADIQKSHCAAVKAIHQRLRENWFIDYDYQETLSAERIFSAEEWRGSKENLWAQEADPELTGVRENVRNETQQVMRKE